MPGRDGEGEGRAEAVADGEAGLSSSRPPPPPGAAGPVGADTEAVGARKTLSAAAMTYVAATLQAMATVANCPLVEYPYDPPAHTPGEMQAILKEPLLPEADGTVALPERPGIGVEPDEERLVVVA